MDMIDLAAAHDENFVETFRIVFGGRPGASLATYGTIPVAVTGVPFAFFNAAWILGPSVPADVEAALGHLRGSGLPFVVHVRADLAGIGSTVEAIGLVAGSQRLPCFAMPPRPVPPAPPELAFRRVGESEWADFLAVQATDIPSPGLDALYLPEMLERPAVRAFVGYVGTVPVTTAMAVRAGATLGIYSIATVPDQRGRGYGTAATWHLMRDAEPGWEAAVLQSSEMGRPVYERMGFELVGEFVEYRERPSG
ncbi:MAG: GNAT family N-acetyltransferase [Chloroflexi bacterium]|nr:GNAT family N-acetyltransferase [Chloroflexota bacterium]